MSEIFVDLGKVTAPSGVLVLGMAGWIDQWRELSLPLSERARAAAATGGGHFREWLCEAVAVPAAADRPLAVRASTSPSPFDGEPAIATLEIGLGLPWPEPERSVPVRLGDLPVDRCGMVVGDASGLDAWTGMDDEPADGLADVFYWGLYADDAHAEFGGERIARRGVDGPQGWLDLPVAEAAARAAGLEAWSDRLHGGKGLMVSVNEHTDFHRFERAGWHHPLHAGAIDVGGCQVLGIQWDQGDHSIRHRGEREASQVYPVTLEADEAGEMALRWAIPPYDFGDEAE
ncbi:hypothetical protein ACFW6F_31200 [Streptomyces sp. NPDC058746]|uniref:hypothetical protein n=1 Tax=Streptomyces sp. NPDC058746 TaxID=3346622 RepID=UPI0036AD2E01